MIRHIDTGSAIRLQCSDALERPFDFLHFAGSDLLSLNLTCTRDRRLHLTPHLAAQMRDALDHFARHHQLPVNTVNPVNTVHDWSI